MFADKPFFLRITARCVNRTILAQSSRQIGNHGLGARPKAGMGETDFRRGQGARRDPISSSGRCLRRVIRLAHAYFRSVLSGPYPNYGRAHNHTLVARSGSYMFSGATPKKFSLLTSLERHYLEI